MLQSVWSTNPCRRGTLGARTRCWRVRWAGLRGVLALFVLGVAARGGAQPAGLSDGPSIDIPGGVPALARELGIDERTPRSRVLLTAVRVLWEAPDGVAPAADLRRKRVAEYLGRLAAAQPGPAAQPADAVPGFLPATAWTSILRAAGVSHGSVVRAILESRRVGLFYYGVASLDPPTRAYVLSRSSLLKWLLNDGRAALFATFGRAIHVRDGRVLVPGGSEAVPLWEAVAGESTANPDAFIRRVLDADGGRLALVYDGLAHAGEATRRFALGLRHPAEQRVRDFRDFYDASGAALEKWQPRRRPFERMPFDVVHLLFSIQPDPQGELRGPSWSRLWEAVFDPWLNPEQPQVSGHDLEEGGGLDAATLVRLVSVAGDGERRERSEAWLFADRTFRGVPSSAVIPLIVTLKGYSRYPTLLLTLERMGLSDPATYAAAVRAAERLSNADRRLWQFQAALAILERARSARAFDRDVADRLVRALCALTPEGGDDYRGAVARWLAKDVLPVAEPVLPAGLEAGSRPEETRLLALAVGSVASPANRALLALPPVEWEGLKYRVDPAGAALRRLIDVRAKQGGPSLDAVLALSRLADTIASASSSKAAVSAAQQLREAAAPFQAARTARPSALAGEAPRLEKLVEEALERARKLRPTPDAKALAHVAGPLQEAVDYHLADVLGSMAYAPHLGDPGGTALLGGDPSRAHDFRLFKPGTELGRRTAWELPIEWRGSEAGWRVTGSLLGLDTALGQFALRRVAGETIPEAPKLSDAVRQAFTESACLLVPFDLTEAVRDRLLAAVERGRRAVAALTPASSNLDDVAAEVDEWRAQALPWTLANESDRRLEIFSLAELARIGGLREPAAGDVDAWGPGGFSLDQGFRTIYPVDLPWSTLAGRRGVRAVPALVPDLALGLAAVSANLRLPAALTPGLMALATQEFLDTLRTAHEDDWPALVAHAQAVARSRVEDLVAGLTINGPLVPDER